MMRGDNTSRIHYLLSHTRFYYLLEIFKIYFLCLFIRILEIIPSQKITKTAES